MTGNPGNPGNPGNLTENMSALLEEARKQREFQRRVESLFATSSLHQQQERERQSLAAVNGRLIFQEHGAWSGLTVTLIGQCSSVCN